MSTRRSVAEAGGTSLGALRKDGGPRPSHRGAWRAELLEIAKRLHDEGRFDALLGLGGSAGTTVGTAAMRALPVGVPKLMVSTVTAGNVAPYVGTSDLVMMSSVVDVAGVNSISARIYSNATGRDGRHGGDGGPAN